jgi:hypothetical protein
MYVFDLEKRIKNFKSMLNWKKVENISEKLDVNISHFFYNKNDYNGDISDLNEVKDQVYKVTLDAIEEFIDKYGAITNKELYSVLEDYINSDKIVNHFQSSFNKGKVNIDNTKKRFLNVLEDRNIVYRKFTSLNYILIPDEDKNDMLYFKNAFGRNKFVKLVYGEKKIDDDFYGANYLPHTHLSFMKKYNLKSLEEKKSDDKNVIFEDGINQACDEFSVDNSTRFFFLEVNLFKILVRNVWNGKFYNDAISQVVGIYINNDVFQKYFDNKK